MSVPLADTAKAGTKRALLRRSITQPVNAYRTRKSSGLRDSSRTSTLFVAFGAERGNAHMSSKLRTVSWVLLTIVGVLTLLGALASMSLAYFGSSEDDVIGPIRLNELADGRADVETALRARRGTAASFGAGYAVLLLLVVLVPYRKGEKWAYWAVLVGVVVTTGLILLRVPTLDTHLGLAAATIPLGVSLLALALDFGRLSS